MARKVIIKVHAQNQLCSLCVHRRGVHPHFLALARQHRGARLPVVGRQRQQAAHVRVEAAGLAQGTAGHGGGSTSAHVKRGPQGSGLSRRRRKSGAACLRHIIIARACAKITPPSLSPQPGPPAPQRTQGDQHPPARHEPGRSAARWRWPPPGSPQSRATPALQGTAGQPGGRGCGQRRLKGRGDAATARGKHDLAQRRGILDRKRSSGRCARGASGRQGRGASWRWPRPAERTRKQLGSHAIQHVHRGWGEEVVSAVAAVGAALRAGSRGGTGGRG